jgi:hypothetical protein
MSCSETDAPTEEGKLTAVCIPDIVVSKAEVAAVSKNKLDLFLVHYNKFVTSAANQDKGLKLLQYTLWLFSRIYPHKKKPLMKTSFDISFARYILRFYGLPTALEAVRNSSWEDPKAALGGTTGKLMAWAMMAYYPLEHLSYVGWTAPELLPASFLIQNKANRYSAYSCRFWFVYLVAELTQGIMRLRRLYKEQKELGENGGNGQDNSAAAAIQEKITSEKLQLARSALFTLPCVSWSLPKWDTDPWLSDGFSNGLMWLESVISFYQAIRGYRLASSNSSK